MYLITASLLNAWHRLITPNLWDKDIEEEKAEFMRVLNREPTPINEYIEKGFAFEKWCEENFKETKGGVYQVTIQKEMGDYLLYGRLDCLKAGVIYDYKFSSRYEVGKFYDNYQTPMYFELVPEAYKMSYIITRTDKFDTNDILFEEYKREEVRPIKPDIDLFMDWIANNGYSMEKWIAK